MMTNTTADESLRKQREDRSEQRLTAPLLYEAASWLPTQTDSRHICGNIESEGIAIEWHNLEPGTNSTFSGSPSRYPDSLELCLNVAGRGFLQSAKSRLSFKPLTAFLYAPCNHGLRVFRNHGERHRFLTINFSSSFLREELEVCQGALHTLVRQFVLSGDPAACMEGAGPFTADHERLIALLLRPQCAQQACQLRCKGIVLQLMADFLVEPCCGSGSSCDRQKCLARDRVRGVVSILQRDLADPPTLKAIGHEVGCSPFHLSRTFSREMGMTIPQCLRNIRMQYAAELLKSGKCNVTEAATAVGYSSLSHFSQAFCQTIGCCPAMYSSEMPTEAVATCAALCSRAERRVRTHDQQSTKISSPQIDVLLESIY